MADHIFIEWNQDRLAVLTVSEDSKHTVKVAASREFKEHANPQTPSSTAGEELRAWLNTLDVGQGSATVVVPRESVVLRRLQMPAAPEDDLPDLVRFQAASRTSASIESLALDFVPLVMPPDSGQDVISMTMDRDQLARINAVLTGAGLSVSRVLVAPLTIANLVRATSAPKLASGPPELIAYQQAQRVELSILHSGTVILSQSVVLPKEAVDRTRSVKSELKRLLFALDQTLPNQKIETAYYVSGEWDSAVVEVLRDNSSALQAVELGEKWSKASGLESLVGAVLPATEKRLQLDLLNPRKRREVPDRRKLYAAVGVGTAAVIAVLAVMNFLNKKGDLEAAIGDIRGKQREVQAQITQLDPVAKAHDEVAAWNATHLDQVELWNKLREQMPSTDVLLLKNLTIMPSTGVDPATNKYKVATFDGTGYSKDLEEVTRLNARLGTNGFSVTTPKMEKASTGDPDFPISFNLNVTLLGGDAPPPSARGGRRGR